MSPTTALVQTISRTALRTALNTTSLLAPRLAGRAALAVSLRPVGRSGLRPGESELLADARIGQLTVNGKSVVTHQWGDGSRPVLLVHGWESRASRLGAFVTALREQGYSPVAFDAPAHGASSGRDTSIAEYREIIGRLHAEHGGFEAVIAHSFGVLATFFALRDGVEARRVVGIGGVAEFDWIIDGFCTLLGLRERIARDMRGHVERIMFPEEPDIWRRLNATYRPEEIGAPVLLLHDEHDDRVPLDQSRALARAYGESVRLVVTRGLGHRRILGDPEVVAAALDFVRDERPHAVSSEPRVEPVVRVESVVRDEPVIRDEPVVRDEPGVRDAAPRPGSAVLRRGRP
ncbi:alpha/beta hydrolase [Streptomyces sp. NPDC051662]|uniref:alpha/beta hydrolase n=1 Tax=Streptomyces sp. NPDC051662 TaxID=3154750 RepID=UPI0034291626